MVEKYDPLADAIEVLEAEDVDTIRHCGEEIAYQSKTMRRSKDSIIKAICFDNISLYKDWIERTYAGIAARREIKKDFKRI